MSSLTMDSTVQAVPVQTARLRAAQDEGPAVKALLIGIALLFFVLFLLLPLILVFMTAFSRGIMPYLSALSESDTLHAASLTVLVAAIGRASCRERVAGRWVAGLAVIPTALVRND